MNWIYNTVTFLAATVILFVAGLHLYLNFDKVKPTLKALCPNCSVSAKQVSDVVCHCSAKCVCDTNCVCDNCPNCKCNK